MTPLLADAFAQRMLKLADAFDCLLLAVEPPRLFPTLAAAWIAQQQAAGQAPRSPLTGLPLSHLILNENRLARSLIASLQVAGLLSP